MYVSALSCHNVFVLVVLLLNVALTWISGHSNYTGRL